MDAPRSLPLKSADGRHQLSSGLTSKVDAAERILDATIRSFKPRRIYTLFSGGKDSYAAALVSSSIERWDGILHIDTGIGLTETREFVSNVCRQQGWSLEVIGPSPGTYEAMVRRYGFPGPASHRYAYINLKEKPLQKFCTRQKSKPHAREKVMLVTGVRREESVRRMGTVNPVQVDGSRLWVAPLTSWTGADVRQLLDACEVQTNPAAEIFGFSGECWCGAFAKSRDRELLERFAPRLHERITCLEAETEALGVPCRWGEEPRYERRLDAFMPLCEGCIEPSGSSS